MQLLNLESTVNTALTHEWEQNTYQVKVNGVLEDIQALDNAIVVDEAEEDNLHRELAKVWVLNPTVFWYLVLDNELDRHLKTIVTVEGRHDETVSARS
jgi:hypothetical protein